jgi:hypothetical protein
MSARQSPPPTGSMSGMVMAPSTISTPTIGRDPTPKGGASEKWIPVFGKYHVRLKRLRRAVARLSQSVAIRRAGSISI